MYEGSFYPCSHQHLSSLVPQKIKNKAIRWSSNPISEYINKHKQRNWNRDLEETSRLHTHVYCSIIHSSQGMVATQMSIKGWWKKKKWYIHTKEYFSTLKNKKVLLFATTWINLEGIMQCKISQTRTNTRCYHLHEKAQINVKLLEVESIMLFAKVWGDGEMGMYKLQLHKINKWISIIINNIVLYAWKFAEVILC